MPANWCTWGKMLLTVKHLEVTALSECVKGVLSSWQEKQEKHNVRNY